MTGINSGAHWQRMIETSPSAVVDVFRRKWKDSPRLRLQDNGQDHGSIENMPVALFAVSEVAGGNSSSQWQRLLRASIAEELCGCFLRAPVYTNERGVQSTEVHFPYLQVLTQGSGNIAEYFGPHSHKFISALKNNWKAITQRLWEERQYITGADKPEERMVLGALVSDLIDIDPLTFSSVMHPPEDLTISLLTLYLTCSSRSDEFYVCLQSLIDMSGVDCPSSSDKKSSLGMFEYPQNHPFPREFHSRMLSGIRDRSFSSFLSVYTKRLARLSPGFFMGAVRLLCILAAKADWTSNPDREFVHSLLRCQPLFSILISALITPVAETQPPSGLTPTQIPTLVLILLSTCLKGICEHTPEESEGFLRICIHARLFDGLESVLKLDTSRRGDPSLLWWVTSILSSTWTLVVDRNPSLFSLLRGHYPRPRLTHACLKMAFAPSDDLEQWVSQGEDREYNIRTTWLLVSSLNDGAQPHRGCMKRGCRARRVARCKACRTAEYCSAECQTSDWNDHRLMCGFRRDGEYGMRPVQEYESGHLVVGRPDRLPFRFGNVTSWPPTGSSSGH